MNDFVKVAKAKYFLRSISGSSLTSLSNLSCEVHAYAAVRAKQSGINQKHVSVC